MKLIFLLENDKTIGGGEYSIFKFAEHLARKGHQVTVFARRWNKSFDQELPENMKVKIRGGISRIFKGSWIINRAWEKIYDRFALIPFLKREKDIDYICGYQLAPAIKASALGEDLGIKILNFAFESPIWLTEQLGKEWTQYYKGSLKALWGLFEEALKKSDVVLANSRLTMKEVSRWLKREVDFVYPGIDSKEVDAIAAQKKSKQILYIGRLYETKNVADIIKALKKVEDAPRLIICGDGDERARLEELAKKLNVDCDFRGKVTDQEKWIEMKRSLAMVFPSSFEGFGMPPMEALLCGIPCVVSDIPIFKEVYGDYVERVGVHDIDGIARSISKICKDDAYRKRRGKEGRAFVEKAFSWKASVKKIEEALKQ